MVLRGLLLLLTLLVTSSQFDAEDFEDADTDNVNIKDCDPGFYLDNTDPDNPKCSECPVGTKSNDDQTGCDTCPIGSYSDGASDTCSQCAGDLSTVSEGSSSGDCVEVCVVPMIRRTTTGTTAPGTRLSMSGDPTITIVCETGFQYKNAQTSTAVCDTAVPNNGFPRQCRQILMETPNPNSIKKGEEARLVCESSADEGSSPVVSWWKGDEEITASDNIEMVFINEFTQDSEQVERKGLSIKSLDSSHSREDYSCKITLADTSVEQSKTVSLHVLDLTLVPAETSQVLKVGDGLSLQCKMRADTTYDSRTIVWTYSKISGGGEDATQITEVAEGEESPFTYKTATKSEVTTGDTGYYQCTGTYTDTADTNPPQIIKEEYTVIVKGFLVEPSDTFKEVGESLTLSCKVQGDVKASAIVWKKDGSTFSTVSGPISGTSDPAKTSWFDLEINDVQTSDSGVYICEATVGADTLVSAAATVTVLDIGISEEPVDAAYKLGEIATLVCKVHNPTSHPATVVWMEVLDNGDVEVSTDNWEWSNDSPVGTATLKFTEPTIDDTGVYKCKATYAVEGLEPIFSNEAKLFVRGLTQTPDEYTLVKLAATTTHKFTCHYLGDDGIDSISWTVDGNVPDSGVEPGSYLENEFGSSLTIDPVTTTSGGVVKCTVNFKLSTVSLDLSAETILVVHSIKTAPPAETVSGDASVDIMCVYAGTNDPDTVQWIVDDIVRTSDDTGYSVNTENFGSNERTTTLTISDRESTDKNKEVTCEFIFTSTLPEDSLSATTSLIFRGLETELDAQYVSLGETSMSFTCVLGVGSDGAVPHATKWYYRADSGASKETTPLESAGNYQITTDTEVDNGKFETILTIPQDNIAVALAGLYRCHFKIKADSDEAFESEGKLDVRLVTTAPTDAIIYGYKNAGLKLSCTLDASDNKDGMTWTGPNGIISDGTSTDLSDPKIHILTLPNDATAGEYTCEFTYSSGGNPTGTFADVNVHLIEMLSDTNMYSTYGDGVQVTFSCQVSSPSELSDLNFHDGSNDVTASDRKFEGGKTKVELVVTVDAADKAGTYSCRKSAEETSVTTSTLSVMTWLKELPGSYKENPGTDVVMTCRAEWNTLDANKPVITWLKDGATATETQTDTDDAGKAWVESTLPVTLAGNAEYSCTATYAGLTAGTAITSKTNVISSSATITPASYQIKNVGETAMFTCVVVAGASVNIKWRKRADDYTIDSPTYTDLSTSASQEAYDTGSSSRKSTLTLGDGNTLALTDTSDSIECYDSALEISAIMELDVFEITDLVSTGVVKGEAATFTCVVTVFDKTPVVQWYKKGTSTDILIEGGTNPESGKYELAIASVDEIDSGKYLCKVTYDETDDLGPSTFSSGEVNLYVRELNPVPTTPVYIHTGESISLDCTLGIIEEAAGSTDIKWYKDGTQVEELASVVVVTDHEYDGDNKNQKITYVDTNVDKDDGGVYKCEYNFLHGDPISFEITVYVHLLTALEESYTNPTELSCEFAGSNKPTITWWKVSQADGDDEATYKEIDPTKSEFEAFSLTPGTWDDKMITGKLNIDLLKLKDSTGVTCKLVFEDMEETGNQDGDGNLITSDDPRPLETQTTIHKRNFISKTETVYTTGGLVTLECSFFYGASGIGPSSVEWLGLDSIAEGEREIDPGTNTGGSRTTTLKFPDTNDGKYSGTYTCKFVYTNAANEEVEKYEETIQVFTRLITIVPDTKGYIHTNEGFSVTCTFAGSEIPSAATWTKDDSPLTSGSGDYTLEYTIGEKKAELTKTNPTSSDDGVYKCTFTMETSGDHPSGSTNIVVGLLTMAQSENYYGAVGGNLALGCSMKSDKVADIYWFKDGTLVENVAPEQLINNVVSSPLAISDLSADDHDGVYSCSLSNAADQDTHKEKSTTTITLTTLDFTEQPPAKTFGVAGVDVRITCKTNYAKDQDIKVDVVWLVNDGSEPDVDGEKFFSGASNSGETFVSSLAIAFTADMLEKSYSCKFTFSGDNVGTTNSITSTSTAITQMAISGLEDTVYLESGKDIKFSCTALGGSATTISWTLNGEDYTSGIVGTPVWDEGTHSITSEISITGVDDDDDDGLYVCRHSGDPSVTDSITLDVYEVVFDSIEVKSDVSTTLTCFVKGISSPFTFAWTDASSDSVTAKSDTEVNADDNMNSELTVTPNSDTTYTCTVTDPLGNKADPKTAKLNVFELTTTDAKVRTGKDAVLTCEITGITQAVTVVFNDGTTDLESENDVRLINQGTPLDSDATTQTATMTLYGVETDAIFTCKVTSGEFPESKTQTEEVAVTLFGISLDTKYAIKEVGDTQDFVCTGEGGVNIKIEWTESGSEDVLDAVLGDYDPDTATRTSTLSFTNLKVSDSKEYICTVTFGDEADDKVTSKLKLDVVEITPSPDVGEKTGEDVIFSCDYNTFTEATPSVKWFQKNTGGGEDLEQEESKVNNDAKGKSVLTLSNVQFDQSGQQYYCQIEYQESGSGASGPSTFKTGVKTLYVRELLTSEPTPEYVHTGEIVSLVCDLKVKTEAELESVKWYIDSQEVLAVGLIDTANFDTSNTLQKTTYTDAVPDKTEGGVYKCEYNFVVGEAISVEFTVAIHFLTQWPEKTINEETLRCEFKGTNQPTITWYTAADQEVQTGGDSPYTTAPGSWNDNAITATLSIDKEKYTELASITCKITFSPADITDPLETTTAVHFREISEQSETTYTTGDNVVLSCVFDFTKGGTGPTTVTWSGIDSLTVTDEYTIDLGSNEEDGTRTTTLTLKDIDDGKYAGDYTCDFEYSDTENYESEDIQVVVRVVSVEATQYANTPANFKITCDFLGSEKPTSVTWSFTGENESSPTPVTMDTPGFDLALIKDNTQAVLTKGSPVDENTGVYKCEWEFSDNPNLKPSGTQNLYVALIKMPQKDLSPINETPETKVTLTCTVLASATRKIYWYKGNTPLAAVEETFADGVVTSEFVIDSFSNSDIGSYSCRLENDGTTDTASRDSVVLAIQGLETIPAGAGTVYVEKEQSATLSCTVDHRATITWTKDGVAFDDAAIFDAGDYDSDSDSTTSTLTFTSVTADNEGVYVCTFKSLSATFTIDMYGVEVTNKEVKSGEETELVCKLTGVTTLFGFSWTDSESVPVTSDDDDAVSAENVLESTITVTPTEDTTYTCSITDSNGDSAVQKTVTLNVFEITDPEETVAVVGTATSLECGVTGNTGTPSYKWYKVGQDTPVFTDPGSAAVSTYSISDPQFSDDGAYKCSVAMTVGDFTNDAFDSNTAELIVKQLVATFESETTVKSNTDFLKCTYTGDNDVSSVVWTGPDGTIDESEIDTSEYSEDDNTITTTYTFTNVAGDDAGDYECTFNFNKASMSPMSKTTTVTVAVLTEWEAITVNQETLDCIFTGTYEPESWGWFTADNVPVVTTEGSPYSITPASFVGNTGTSTLTIDKSLYTDVTSFTCKIGFKDTDVFPDSSDGLSTTTAVHYREITTVTPTTYTTGEDVTISCVLDYTRGGTGPTSVEWTQIDGLTMSDEYNLDLGSDQEDGTRTTTLKLKGIDDIKFAKLYTCGFKYSETEKYTDDIQLNVRVASVDNDSQYVHTNANFKITCDLASNETPTGVTWSHLATGASQSTTVTTDTTDVSLDYNDVTYQAVLTKSSPVSADDGEYTCEYGFTDEPTVKATAMADIVAALIQMPQHPLSPLNKTPDQSVVLTCTVKSDVKLDIFWYKGATLVQNDFEETLEAKVVSSELSINKFSSASAGEYSCRLDNDGSLLRVSEQRVILKLQGLETVPAAAGNVYIRKDTSLTLKCTIDNMGTVTWTKDGEVFDDGTIYSAGTYDTEEDSQTSSLTFASVSKENEGVYVCTFESLSSSFILDVFDISVTSKEVKSGEESVLTCKVTDITAPFSFSWTDKDGGAVSALSESVADENDEQESELTVTPDSDTTYKCTVTDASLGEESITATLNVFEITNPTDVYAELGTAVSLECGVTGNTGTPSYKWYKVGQDTPVFTDPGSAAVSTYSISDPQFSDDGEYFCRVTLTAGDVISDEFDSDTASLVVRQLTASFNADTVIKTSLQSFVCTYKGDGDISSVVWDGPNGDISDADKIVTSSYEEETRTVISTFTLSDFDGDDGGSYKCTFNFNNGNPLSQSTNVIIYSLSQLEARYFSPDEILVTFEGTFEPSITWYIGGEEYNSEVNTQLTTSVPSTWSSNSVTFKLAFKMSAFGFGMQPFTVSAKMTFGDQSDEELTTQDAHVYKREIMEGLGAKYTITGSEQDFVCKASGEDNTIFTIKWYLGDKLLEDSQDHVTITEGPIGASPFNRVGTLTVDNTRSDFNGQLKCSVTWPEPALYTAESVAEVSARGAYMEEYSYSDIDGDGVMVCSAWKPPSQQVTFTWKKPDGNELTAVTDEIEIEETSADNMFTSTVKILDMETGDSGDYKCEVTFNSEAPVVFTTNLQLISAKIEHDGPVYDTAYVDVGAELMLTCTYTGTEDPSKIQWLKGTALKGHVLTDQDITYEITTHEYDTDTSTKKSVLKLKKSIVSESGVYTCKWELENGSPTATVNVNIMGLEITGKVNDKTYSVDGTPIISCKYTGTDPGTVTWLKGGQSLEEGGVAGTPDNGGLNHHVATYTLTISEAEAGVTDGSYSCKMEWADGYSKTVDTDLVVRIASVVEGVSHTPVSHVIVSDGTLHMKCLYKGVDLPNGVKWFYGETEIDLNIIGNEVENEVLNRISDTVKQYQSVVTLSDKTMEEDGKYSCRFHMDDSQDPTAEAEVAIVTVTTAETCVFVDYGATSTKSLSCTYTGTIPALSFKKKFPDDAEVAGELSEVDGKSQTGTFELIDVTDDKAGTYECVFYLPNDLKVSEEIKVAPRRAVVSTSVATLSPRLLARDSITITCTVSSGAKSITWFKDGAKFSSYDTVLDTETEYSVSFDIETGSSGAYTCKGVYYDDDCPTQHTFPSAETINLEVIQATANQQPEDVTVKLGDSTRFECVFPDPYGESKTPVIQWRVGKRYLIGDGDLYIDTVKVMDGSISNERGPGTYTTILSIAKVTMQSAGDYTCTIKWDMLFIHSDPATLIVIGISSPPSHTNVPAGVDAKLTCVAQSDSVATITFHKSSDDSTVSTVTTTDDSDTTSTSRITTTGVLKITGVTASDAIDYYCKASWGDTSIKSSSAHLSVLNVVQNSMTDMWDVVGDAALQKCFYNDKLMVSSSTALKDEDDREVFAETSVDWEYDKTGTWTDISDNDKMTIEATSNDGDVRIGILKVGPLTSDVAEFSVRCKVSYTADSTNHLQGGVITSQPVKINIIRVVSFNVPSSLTVTGDTITLSCSATGPTKPTFSFWADKAAFSADYFTEVSAATSVVDAGDTTLFTSEYVVTVNSPNIILDGQSVVCQAQFDAGTVKSAEEELNTYFDCGHQDTKDKITLLKDDFATISYGTVDADGSLTATTQCIPNESSVKYTKAASTANSAATSICSKDTGLWTPPYLSPCLRVSVFSEAKVTQIYDLTSWNDPNNQYELCSAGASAELTEDKIEEYLTATDNAECGAVKVVPCLGQETCTIKTEEAGGPDLNGCSWDKTTKKLSVFVTVEFTPELDVIQEKLDAVTLEEGDKLKFWNCASNGGNKRNAVLIEILDRGPVDSRLVMKNSTFHEEDEDPDFEIKDQSDDEMTAKLRLLLIVGAVCFTALLILAATVMARRRVSRNGKKLQVDIFPGRLIISDA